MCTSVGSSSCWISFIGQVGISPGSDRTLTDWLQSPPDDEQGGRMDDAAAGARDDPDQQGQDESLQGLPTEKQQRHSCNDSCPACKNPGGGRLHDAEVHHLL